MCNIFFFFWVVSAASLGLAVSPFAFTAQNFAAVFPF